MRRTMMLPALAALLAVGCGSEDQLRRVEQEVGDLKLEVFKLRQAVEDGNKKAQTDQQAATESRTQDRRFQADLQESLRQVQDTTRALNNRLGNLPRTAGTKAAQAEAPGQSRRHRFFRPWLIP
jgi:predicted  nucleic acid-binding Zn-ribbon protein